MNNDNLKSNSKVQDSISVDLSNNNLITLPRTIYENKSLRYLDLSNNRLKEIPEELFENLDLFSLNLSNNKIEFLPASISNLKNLRLLNISKNQIEILPLKLSQLKNLKYLDIRENRFTERPEVINDLTWLITFLTDEYENIDELIKAKNSIRTLLMDDSWDNLIKFYNVIENNNIKENILREFGFIISPLLLDINILKKDTNLVVMLSIWKSIVNRDLLKLKKVERLKVITSNESIKPELIVGSNNLTPESKGEKLEESVFELFNNFFTFNEREFYIKLEILRKQNRGRQFGFDLNMEFSIKGNDHIKCLIECKNYSNSTSRRRMILSDIADKLLDAESYIKGANQWILISPYLDPDNNLDNKINEWKELNRFPFRVQIWSPQNRVDEFFGLVPDLYDQFEFMPRVGDVHPREWDEEKRFEVFKKWLNLLTDIPLNLTSGWGNYIFNPSKLRLQGEDNDDLEDLFKNHVRLKCIDKNGVFLNQDLDTSLLKWLSEPIEKSRVLILLGEFGDGKSTYTYLFSRILLERFRKDPKNEWIPIRFSLKLQQNL